MWVSDLISDLLEFCSKTSASITAGKRCITVVKAISAITDWILWLRQSWRMWLSPVELAELALFCLALSLVSLVVLELIWPFLDLAWFRWLLVGPAHLIARKWGYASRFVFTFIWESITAVHTLLVLLLALIYDRWFDRICIHCHRWCIPPVARGITNQVVFVNELLVELRSDWLVIENTLNTCLWFQTLCLWPINCR